MDKNYRYKIDENIEFQNYPMLRETRAILAVLYRDYWASECEKVRILDKQKQDIQLKEEEKQEKYNYEDLLKTRKQIQEKSQQLNKLISYKEPWYLKFINFIKFIRNDITHNSILF